MTEKDYIKIAEVLRKANKYSHFAFDTLELFHKFAVMLKKDNSRFDRDRFSRAVFKAF